ncbi:GspH/FimT family pseudopilin [Variovorax sp. PAMC26660]|uniref:GspH/FimT family pseudopilin n=1 Tax=Variovorax sp. PAMC26660 TaxID=2762322 RepID=UPI00164ED3AC|nr:GspH/FimT family pseudopilin [Variovorax sp. PAMC26660]QNK70156.1 GspH/FimT family pseudopilin [Variovorax sp. PAMC26660]
MNKLRRSLRGPSAHTGQADGRPSAGRMRGVTLVELLVVVSIIGVLLAWAVPSFNLMIQRNRMASESNGFVGDLQFARAEAIKRGQPVTLCPANATSTACANSATWSTGWIVFNDPNGNQTVDAGEVVLRKQTAWRGTDTFIGTQKFFSFSRDGFAMGLSGPELIMLKTTPENTTLTRCVKLALTGRQQVLSGSDCK